MAGRTQIDTEAVASLSPGQRQALRALQMQRYRLSFPYHSTIKFPFSKAGEAGGPYTYTLGAGFEARAFSYGQRQTMASAGFPSALALATPADTNLAEANQTVGAESVLITGIALQVLHGAIHPDSANADHMAGEYFADARALAALEPHVSVRVGLNGDKQVHELGTLGMLPGAGGLTGAGIDALQMPQIEGSSPQFHFHANGWPIRSNYYKLPEGLIWQSKGNADSMLNVIFRLEREVILYSGGDPENNAIGVDEAAAAGIRGYAFPEEIQVLLKVILVGEKVGPRSRVS